MSPSNSRVYHFTTWAGAKPILPDAVRALGLPHETLPDLALSPKTRHVRVRVEHPQQGERRSLGVRQAPHALLTLHRTSELKLGANPLLKPRDVIAAGGDEAHKKRAVSLPASLARSVVGDIHHRAVSVEQPPQEVRKKLWRHVDRAQDVTLPRDKSESQQPLIHAHVSN